MKSTLTLLVGLCFLFWIKPEIWTTHALALTTKTTEIAYDQDEETVISKTYSTSTPSKSASSTTITSTGIRCYSCSSQVSCSQDDIAFIKCDPQDICFTRNISIVYSFGDQVLPPHTDVLKGCFDRTQASNTNGCIDGQTYLESIRLSSPGVTVVSTDGKVCFCESDLCNNKPLLRPSLEALDVSRPQTEQTEKTTLTTVVLTESSANLETVVTGFKPTTEIFSTSLTSPSNMETEQNADTEMLNTTPVMSNSSEYPEIPESQEATISTITASTANTPKYTDFSEALDVSSPQTEQNEKTTLTTVVLTESTANLETDQYARTTVTDFKPTTEVFSTSLTSPTNMETEQNADTEVLNTIPVMSTSSEYPEIPESQEATISTITASTTNTPKYTESSAAPCIIPPLGNVITMVNTERNDVPNGTVIEYSCQDGHVLIGNAKTLCLDGSWVLPEVPVCEAKACTKPNSTDDKLKCDPDSPEYKNGTEIEYKCEEGYVLSGISTSLCLYGEWIPSGVSTCEAFKIFEETLANASNIFFQENITSEDIAIAAQIVEMASEEKSFLKEDTKRIMLVITTLEDIAESGDPSIEVTDPVIETVNNLLDIEEDVFQLGTEENERVITALEKQISNVQTQEGNYTRTFKNVGVSAVKINSDRIQHNLVFAYLLENERRSSVGEDLRGKTPQLYADNETVPTSDVLVSISLPRTVLNFQNGGSNSTEVPVSFIVYSNSKLFTPSEPLKPEENKGDENSNVTERIASQVISPIVENNENSMEELPLAESVIAKFSTDLDINGTRECVSWSYDETTGESHWSREGCTRMPDEGSLTVCSCKQLASFAVLVRVRGNYESSPPLYYITLVGSIISCVCLVLCILTFVSLKKLRSKQPSRIHINLCVSLLGFYIAFLISTVAVDKPVFCAISSAVIHFFALATIAWMSVEAINMYFLFIKTYQTSFRYFIPVACVLAYGCPALAAVLVAVLDKNSDYSSGTYCFISPGPAFYFGFLTEVGVLFVFNVILFIWIIRKMLCRPLMVTQTKASARRKEIITRVRHGILFWFVLGLSWIFGFAAAVDTKTQIFQYLYCICIALQGFVMFLLLCVANPDFRKSLRNLTALETLEKSTSNLSTKDASGPSSSKATAISESEPQSVA